jgi:uncharacterized membrane protein YhhN
VSGVPRPSGVALAAAGLLAAAAYLAAARLDAPALRLAAKPVPVLALAVWVATRGRGPTARAVTAGLVLSALGDVLLDRGRFVPGLLAFLLAHVSYAAGFTAARPQLLPLRAAPFLGFGAAVYLALRGGLGAMAVPVGAYVAVICTMMWRAAARVGGASGTARAHWLGLAGALAFAASDTLIAFDRFHAPMPGASAPIMVLYWLGQSGIAASCAGGQRAARAPAGVGRGAGGMLRPR